ncbi:hypothetical protein Cfla_1309 [Cellulomonas flavigena DSM 20109]|uniref:Uncharacterized protein n=1 Tax=Cellulomonas flavigena (strain ATCC 482 / DSM 20109 / BCRC 11376 / JCM 18109 / NBRC 3775 / NCIMB 8073 / NRS 134) TaxID=446466 RepID=D5UC94_CELFN|nr:hypothetical protein [Cellulomonas flavigena]ADG74208.1 hypothetical protein Cfla_1309 [Cellulomonas flavigena DSM 20109]
MTGGVVVGPGDGGPSTSAGVGVTDVTTGAGSPSTSAGVTLGVCDGGGTSPRVTRSRASDATGSHVAAIRCVPASFGCTPSDV